MAEIDTLIQIKLTCMFEAVKLKQHPSSGKNEYMGIDVVDIAKKLEQYVLNN